MVQAGQLRDRCGRSGAWGYFVARPRARGLRSVRTSEGVPYEELAVLIGKCMRCYVVRAIPSRWLEVSGSSLPRLLCSTMGTHPQG